jgi:hypothetical protein
LISILVFYLENKGHELPKVWLRMETLQEVSTVLPHFVSLKNKNKNSNYIGSEQ